MYVPWPFHIQLDSVLVKSPAFQKTSPPCGVITWRVRRRAGPPHHREPRVLGWCPVAGPRVPIEWYSNSSLQQHGMDSMAQPPPEDTASRCPVLWQGVVTWQNLARNHRGRWTMVNHGILSILSILSVLSYWPYLFCPFLSFLSVFSILSIWSLDPSHLQLRGSFRPQSHH